VVLYAFTFFGTKMAVYCLLLELPTFLPKVLGYSRQEAANVQTSIDVGAILGSMALGLISDKMHGKRSPVSLVGVTISIIIIWIIFA
jgi:sugar phosphate permease